MSSHERVEAAVAMIVAQFDEGLITQASGLVYLVEQVLAPDTVDALMRSLPESFRSELHEWLMDPDFGSEPILHLGAGSSPSQVPEAAIEAARLWRVRGGHR